MIVLHHPDCASYGLPGHPERPQRVIETAAHLRRAVSRVEWRMPANLVADDDLLLAHTRAHLDRLRVPRPFDGDTPYFENIDRLARLSASAALEGAQLARQGHPVLSLMRPPGHHATSEQAMGFCYLNNIAIAALRARRDGVERVAVWDFDAHHGNGTESILSGCDGVLFCSVHQFPGYPGSGAVSAGNCLNYPVPPGTPAAQHLAILRQSWEAVLDFRPDLVLVSAGFDAYQHDPITTMCLRQDEYLSLGSWLHQADLPTLAVLEGGYSEDLPFLVATFLEGWRHG